MIRVKGEIYEGEDWAITLGGKEYSSDDVERIIHWALKTQFDTLDDILRERGLLALGESLIRAPDEEDIGDGWRLTLNPILHTQHIFSGLKVPHLWERYGDDDAARKTLREKMEKLGDLIWGQRALRR